MKASYENRGYKFALYLSRLFRDCETWEDFTCAMEYYNMTHSRKVAYAHGVSRFAVIRADYVIKFDMTPEQGWEDGRAGNNSTEEDVYNIAVADGMEYLLAKTTVVEINGRHVSIMPRINHVNDYDRCWWNYCTDDEEHWLCNTIGDLHEGNVGYRNGKVCVIDYAWA